MLMIKFLDFFFRLSLRSIYLSEKILVIRSMGLQIQTSYLLGQEKTNFIPQQKIVDIVINEAISMVCMRRCWYSGGIAIEFI